MFAIPLNVAGVLAITPRPRGNDWLEDDMRTLGRHGVDVLVSLLEPPEEEELGLEAEGRYAEAAGLSFLSVPIPDLGVPAALEPFQAVIVDIVSRLHQGRQVAVHCRQSVGRSGLFTVSVAVATGLDLATAIDVISTARGVRVPETPAQLAWLRTHQASLLAAVAGP